MPILMEGYKIWLYVNGTAWHKGGKRFGVFCGPTHVFAWSTSLPTSRGSMHRGGLGDRCEM
jgi:hypothetical protein